MTEHIALKSINEHVMLQHSPFTSLKREALLFDKIGILNLNSILDMCFAFESGKRILDSISLSREQLMDARWLEEKGVIFDARLAPEQDEKLKAIYTLEEYRTLRNLLSNSLIAGIQFWLLFNKPLPEAEKKIEIEKLRENSLLHEAITLRLIALQIEINSSANVLPLLSYSEYIREIPKSQNIDVVQVVIKQLPLPGINTPWEQVLDFKGDPDNQKNLLSLRRWIRKIASENLKSKELEDELQWLMNEFESQMKLHKMKANTETIETCIKAPLEIIEDIVKFKWSKIPEPFFAIRKRKIALLEAEMDSTGKEIAYLVKAKEAFNEE